MPGRDKFNLTEVFFVNNIHEAWEAAEAFADEYEKDSITLVEQKKHRSGDTWYCEFKFEFE